MKNLTISELFPSPWRWVDKGGYFNLESSDGRKVADDGSSNGEYGGWFNTPDGSPDRNARLIAIAPELLEVLIEIERQWTSTGGVHGDFIGVARKIIARVSQ